MPLSDTQSTWVKNLIRNSLKAKIGEYNSNTSQPFHERLFGKSRLAQSSFIHSVRTSFGMTIFENVAAELASGMFNVQRQVDPGRYISEKAETKINQITNELRNNEKEPDNQREIEMIREVCQEGDPVKVKLTQVDLYLERKGNIFLFDLKTSQPNKGGFQKFKETLLEWAAAVLFNEPDAKINTLIAIPYNPMLPEPYEPSVMKGTLDPKHQLKVGKDFWDFLAGKGTYDDLLICFKDVGDEMRPEIDEYFERFNP